MSEQYTHWSQFRQPLILWGGINGYLFIPFILVIINISMVKVLLYFALIIITVVIERIFKYQYSYIPSAVRKLVFGGNKYTRRGRRRYSL
ncbi:hypothetical protein [Acinetobacter sp. YH01009]|uniref:hypothetical protein n=1 Tax=Acinetobacter sp. YH01009 TaxID=2601025 RepID=UPI0015D1A0C8|nr:hypothetical protein [Acinetobacter sp. YH01009]